MRFLLISEAYPPDLRPGALSVGKLVHGCISEGHQVTVVTQPHDPRGQGGTDISACWQDIAECAVRVSSPRKRMRRLVIGGVARLWSRIPRVGAWAFEAYRTARSLLRTRGFDCVITGYEPFRTALIGYALKREFGIPWAVRFPDPSPVCLYPPPYGTGRAETIRDRYIVNRVKWMLGSADALIAPSARMADYLDVVYGGAFGPRRIVLPHVGWSRPSTGARSSSLEILHSGIMMHGRESEQIARVLCSTLRTARALGIKTRVTFVGYASGKKVLPEKMLEVADDIRWLPPRSYEASLAQMSDATALLLVEAVMSDGIFLPSKVADYAVSGKPMLMFSPPNGTVADLVGGFNHPGFLGQEPEVASRRLVAFLQQAAAGRSLDDFRFPQPSLFAPKAVVGSLIQGMKQLCLQ